MASETHKLIKALGPKFTAFFSVIGSAQILANVVSRYRKEPLTPRHRLLAAMSFWDLLASLAWFLTTWPVPDREEIYWVVWNVGNQPTCTAQGFFAQLAIGTVFYNACLALYYVLAIRYGKQNEWIGRQVEPWMHAIVTVFTLTTSIVPATLGLYNPTGWDCWIMAYPLGCTQSYQLTPGSDETTTCTRGDNARFYQVAFSYGPTWLVILFVSVAMLLVFLKVRRTERASARFSISNQNSSRGVSPQSGRHRLQRLAALQGLLYVGALLGTWGFLMVVQIYWEITGHLASVWVYTLAAILLPAQGLFNALIYFYSPMNVVQWQLNGRPSGLAAVRQSVLRVWTGLSRSFDDNTASMWAWGDGGHIQSSSSSAPPGSKVQPVEESVLEDEDSFCGDKGEESEEVPRKSDRDANLSTLELS